MEDKNMTNEQIFKKAIEKAVKNGWNKEKWGLNIIPSVDFEFYHDGFYYKFESRFYPLEMIIFSHDFAEKFWGNKNTLVIVKKVMGHQTQCCVKDLPAWKHHLQQMVLEKDPILYLKRFLND